MVNGTLRWAMLLSAALLTFSAACSGANDGSSDGGSQNNNDPGNNDINNDDNNDDNNDQNNDANNDDNNNASLAGLVINEVAATGDPEDWFELYNGTDAAIDLSDFTFTDAIADAPDKGAFAQGATIGAGQYLQIFISDEAVGFKIGGDEELGLFDGDGNLVDSVDWDEGDSPEGGSFARIPDGTGPFKTVATPTPGAANEDGEPDNDPNNDPNNDGPICGDDVCEGTETNDDCPMDCDPEPLGLVINEVAAAGTPDGWVELYNSNDYTMNLSSFTLTNAFQTLNQRTLPDGTSIGPRQHLVFSLNEDTFGFDIADSGELYLYDPEGEYVDGVLWEEGQSPVGGSYSRIPDGTGDFQTTIPDSQGATNVPGDGDAQCGDDACEAGETLENCSDDCFLAVNEVAAAGDPDDWVELFNHSLQTIDLSGWFITDAILGDPRTGSIDPGLLIIEGKPSKGVSLQQAAEAIWAEIELLKAAPVAERELQKWKNQIESTLLFSETSVLTKAINLAFFEVLGDADLINREKDLYQAVRPEDVHRVANDILVDSNCSELLYQPANPAL